MSAVSGHCVRKTWRHVFKTNFWWHRKCWNLQLRPPSPSPHPFTLVVCWLLFWSVDTIIFPVAQRHHRLLLPIPCGRVGLPLPCRSCCRHAAVEENILHFPLCPLTWGKSAMAMYIRSLHPPAVIAIFSGGGSVQWRQLFLVPHWRSTLHAAANAANDGNHNQTAAIPCDDGPQPLTSPPPPSLTADCCILVVVASQMDVKRDRATTLWSRWGGQGGQLVVAISTSPITPAEDQRAGMCRGGP